MYRSARAKVEEGCLKVETDACNGCGRCKGKCPFGVTEEYMDGCRIYIGGRWGKKISISPYWQVVPLQETTGRTREPVPPVSRLCSARKAIKAEKLLLVCAKGKRGYLTQNKLKALAPQRDEWQWKKAAHRQSQESGNPPLWPRRRSR